MKPKFVVYECENCGKLFYRDVVETIVDDGAECHVMVELVAEQESAELEEFPMCNCLGGNNEYVITTPRFTKH